MPGCGICTFGISFSCLKVDPCAQEEKLFLLKVQSADEMLILPSESPARPDWISCFPKGSGVVQAQERLGLVSQENEPWERFQLPAAKSGRRQKSESEIPANFREMSSPGKRGGMKTPVSSELSLEEKIHRGR